MLHVVHYLNQFFGQIGGEEKADLPPVLKREAAGPAAAFAAALGDIAETTATIICGDNYMAEHQQEAIAGLLEYIRQEKPDLFIAGPAFNAGRYGPACGAICHAVASELKIPVITGMYIENPGVELYRDKILIARTTNSVAGMRAAIDIMCALIRKLVGKQPLGPADEEGYLSSGRRNNIWRDKSGAERATDMLLDVLAHKAVVTELPMPVFDEIAPAAPVENVATARIALVTEGGLVPKGNPDGLESSRASKFMKLSFSGLRQLSADAYQTVHGGFNNAFINQNPNRLLPLDVSRELVDEGVIGELAEYCFTTTGNGTSYANSKNFGKAIGEALRADKVRGVILTST